ncbi:hypothetical protein OSTOST_22659 [Ostertagia ostertagi]
MQWPTPPECCQKTVSNIIARVVDALAHPDIVQQFIKFKPEDEQWCRARSNEFARTGRMSNVIGAVDGTLVRIRTPAVDGYQYVSRKGTSCLNVCFIVDAVGRVLYVNTGSPDQCTIPLFGVIPRNSCGGLQQWSGLIIAGYRPLGDNGYANGKSDITTIIAAFDCGDDHRSSEIAFPHSLVRTESGASTSVKDYNCMRGSAQNKLVPEPTTMRQLGRRKATMAHPAGNVPDVRHYIAERLKTPCKYA